jgi:hypothetical protein
VNPPNANAFNPLTTYFTSTGDIRASGGLLSEDDRLYVPIQWVTTQDSGCNLDAHDIEVEDGALIPRQERMAK